MFVHDIVCIYDLGVVNAVSRFQHTRLRISSWVGGGGGGRGEGGTEVALCGFFKLNMLMVSWSVEEYLRNHARLKMFTLL